ncbi:MAG: hypothetical protein JRI23_25785 [Deltaproteobacteria bacterium]|nr:hypothetical protein [Deltaproteobacteria bacterium]MBW2535439.1 hypothetical protein [Deltaproteobacteria bacterium]
MLPLAEFLQRFPEGVYRFEGRTTDGDRLVIVSHENPPPERTLDVMLPPTATSLSVPPEFLTAGADCKYEVLAIEASGNQTLAEIPFSTAP